MESITIERKRNYFDRFFEFSQNSSGTFSDINLEYPSTSSPYVFSFLKNEIENQLQPILEAQNALIDLSSELSSENDAIKFEIANLKQVYSENYQLKKKIKNINSIHSLKILDTNWNGNNAEPFSDTIIQRALDIINSPSLKFQPDVFPTGRQSIQFEYEKSNGNYLEIEIFEDNYSAYSEIKNEETEFESISLDDIFRLVNEFYSRF